MPIRQVECQPNFRYLWLTVATVPCERLLIACVTAAPWCLPKRRSRVHEAGQAMKATRLLTGFAIAGWLLCPGALLAKGAGGGHGGGHSGGHSSGGHRGGSSRGGSSRGGRAPHGA